MDDNRSDDDGQDRKTGSFPYSQCHGARNQLGHHA
jgi:hypothetical protein